MFAEKPFTDEQLAAVSGGCGIISSALSLINPWQCPKCGSGHIKEDKRDCICKKCGYKWRP